MVSKEQTCSYFRIVRLLSGKARLLAGRCFYAICQLHPRHGAFDVIYTEQSTTGYKTIARCT